MKRRTILVSFAAARKKNDLNWSFHLSKYQKANTEARVKNDCQRPLLYLRIDNWRQVALVPDSRAVLQAENIREEEKQRSTGSREFRGHSMHRPTS